MRELIRELFETVILALIVFLTIHISIQNYAVQGPSMSPTLHQGDYLIVNKLAYIHFNSQLFAKLAPFLGSDRKDDTLIFPFNPPQRGDVVIFRFPRDDTRDFVKRVIAIPGDVLSVIEQQLYVNGKLQLGVTVNEHNLRNIPNQVSASTYFVVGDNRTLSNDSRNWGPVPSENIIGEAWMIFWPLDRLGKLKRFSTPGES